MQEHWRVIEEFPNYMASNHGKIKDIATETLRPTYSTDGYLSVSLKRDGQWIKKPVAGIVATAFVPGKQEGRQVNHKDRNKQNNMAINLEWVTAKENRDHEKRTRRVKQI